MTNQSDITLQKKLLQMEYKSNNISIESFNHYKSELTKVNNQLSQSMLEYVNTPEKLFSSIPTYEVVSYIQKYALENKSNKKY